MTSNLISQQITKTITCISIPIYTPINCNWTKHRSKCCFLHFPIFKTFKITTISQPNIYFLQDRKESRLEDILKFTKKLDRKSTRLNSSHVAISYDVFC